MNTLFLSEFFFDTFHLMPGFYNKSQSIACKQSMKNLNTVGEALHILTVYPAKG